MIRVFINIKGGCGKSISSINIAKGLSDEGKRVLLVDLDGQASASSIILGNDYWGEFNWESLLDDAVKAKSSEIKSDRLTITDALSNPRKTKDCLIKTKFGFDIIPSELSLFEMETRMKLETYRFTQGYLYEAIKVIKDDYDEIIIDCNPSLDILAINAMYLLKDGDGEVIIPSEMSIPSLIGVRFTIMSINMINEHFGINIPYRVIATMVQRNNSQKEIYSKLQNILKDHLFNEMVYYQSKPTSEGNMVALDDKAKMVINTDTTIGNCYKNVLKEMEGVQHD